MPRKVYDASELKPATRKSPADAILEEFDGEYKKLTQVAKEVGVHPETLRRLCRTEKVNAPTKAIKQGGMTMYLFTEADVEEIRAYFEEGRQAFIIGPTER